VRGVIRGPRTILALLTALNLLNYLDRFVLSAVLKNLQDDLHLSGLRAGWLATVFLIGYFATSPIFGSMADRAGTGGRKVLIAAGILVWSLATIGSGLAHGYWSLVAARAFVGVGEASYATIAPTLIDEIAPPERKGRWLAIFYTAMPVGAALGYLVGGAVEAATHDWRMAFFVAGGPGLVLALLCMAIVEPESRATAARPSILASARELLLIPAYRNVVLGYCAFTFAMGGFAYWAPKYLTARYAMADGRASMLFGAVTVVGGLVGTLVGGWLGDRWTKGRSDDPAVTRASLLVCAVSAALGAPLALAAILSPQALWFFVLVVPCEVGLFLSSGPVNAAILRSVPGGLRASAMALSIFGIHMLGDLWSPPLIGLVADHAPMAWAMLAVPAAFAVGAVIWWRGTVALRLT
jgi:MFS family permease